MSDKPTSIPFWPWQVWRHYQRVFRDMAVRHARERAVLDAWVVEVEHMLKGLPSD
jgi:hypothetical protein